MAEPLAQHRKGPGYPGLWSLLLCMMVLMGCSSPSLLPDGYWRFDPPVQARVLKNALLKSEGDHVLVLTYFGGPVLNSGINTETTEKRLLGHMSCGDIVSTDGGLELQLRRRYELGGDGEGAPLNDTYLVEIRDNKTLLIGGLMNYPDVPYLNTIELTNEEALAFQRFSNACKKH